VLSFSQLKWPEDVRDPNSVRVGRLAWYECEHCGHHILDKDKHKILANGEWRRVDPDSPKSDHVGFRLSALYSPWLSFSLIAAQFLRCKNDRALLQNFTNSWLAEPWEERVTSVSGDESDRLAATGIVPRGMLPPDTRIVAAGVDWHGERIGYYWTVWAWTPGMVCWLVDYGRTMSRTDLPGLLWSREFETAKGDKHVPMVGVDSGYEAPQVYEFTRPYYPRVRPTKGYQKLNSGAYMDFTVEYMANSKLLRLTGFKGLKIDTTFYKDFIAARVKEAIESEVESASIHVCEGVEKSLLRTFSSEHKIRIKNKEVWVAKYRGVNNHWLDSSVIAWALADRLGALKLGGMSSTEPKPTDSSRLSNIQKEKTPWIQPGPGSWV